MAKKKTSSNKKKSQQKKNSSKQSEFDIVSLHPETKRWVISITLFTFAGISFLALFNLAGPGGQSLLGFMSWLFGSLALLFPIILFTLGYIIFNKNHLDIKPLNYFGALLFIFALTALFNLFIPLESLLDQVALGQGGGYVGVLLSYSLLNVIGLFASALVVVALLIIGFVLIFNTSIDDLKESQSKFGQLISKIHEKWYDLRYGSITSEDEEEDFEEEDSIEEEEEIEETDEVPGLFTSKKLKGVKSANSETTKTKEVVEEDIVKQKKKVSYKKVDIPFNLLEESSGTASSGNPIRTKEKIQSTFESFNIPVQMGDVNIGPTVTQYELTPAEGVKLSRITALQDDLALSLASHPLRIEAPIPGKSAVGVEIPNITVEMVRLKSLLQSRSFKTSKSNLEIALGKDVTGKAWTTSIEKMPHLLVAGATGSGKSVCLNTIIVSLLYQNSPETLRFIMVDPKKVELSAYEGIPHLLTPVITDVKKTVNALKWAVAEMERRYTLLQKAGVRNIESYNNKSSEKMPFIVFVIDEMADLMVANRNEVETLIIRLAQMARAVGIHLVLATQRPSVDVITGLIKANVPTRIAFAVASSMDSRTILDSMGAEKLVGKGDMLFSNPQHKKPIRIQGAFLSEEEVTRVTDYIRENYEDPDYVDEVTQKPKNNDGGFDFSDPDDGDELFEEAKEIVVEAGKASTSYLQRRLKIGYSRAARIMDLLEEAGVVGPQEGSKPREILVTEREVDDYNEGFDVQDSEIQPDYDSDEEVLENDYSQDIEESSEEDEQDDEDEEELDEVLESVDGIEEDDEDEEDEWLKK